MKLQTPLAGWNGWHLGLAILGLSFMTVIAADQPATPKTTKLTTAGTYNFPESQATITLEAPGKGLLKMGFRYEKPNGSATSSLEPFKVEPGQWLAVFVEPNQLWVYDGVDKVQLLERTERGFKATSSDVKPAVVQRAPRPITDALALRQAQ